MRDTVAADIDLTQTSPLDSPLMIATFADRRAMKMQQAEWTLRDLADRLSKGRPLAESKDSMPHIKLGRFSGKRTEKRCYRHNAAHVSVSGIEGDYDAGEMTLDDAVAALSEADVAAMLYTSPSHQLEGKGNRWRVLCPLSEDVTPAERADLVARVNGVLGGVLGGESFTASQSFGFGAVRGRSMPDVRLVNGRFLDQCDDLDGKAIGKPRKSRGEPMSATDLSDDQWRVGAAAEMLERAAARLAVTEVERNAALSLEAYLAGGLMANNLATHEQVLDTFLPAMSENGYLNDHASGDQAEVSRIINHQMQQGAKEPFDPLGGEYELDDLDDDADDLDDEARELMGLPPRDAVQISQAEPPVMRRKNGEPEQTAHNAIIYLARVNQNQALNIRHNQFTGRDEWRGREIRDADLMLIRVEIERAGMRQIGSALTADAVRAVAERNAHHPVQVWLNGLSHDGQCRLSTWLTDYLGAEDSLYVQAVARASLIGLVARAMRPGCKHDHVLVLTGAQGAGKSTACRVLGGAWYGDNLPSLVRDDVEASRWLRSQWLVELSEMAPTRKAEAETLKSFLSRAVDRVRAPYGRLAESHPRQCAFIATTNETQFLRDPTGGRRFWPVEVGAEIDTEGLERDREQLFAEAMAAFESGEMWHLSPEIEALAREEQADATEEDPWHAEIAAYLDSTLDEDGEPLKRVTTSQVLNGIGLTTAQMAGNSSNRAAAILRKLGWESKRSNSTRWWQRPA